MALKKKIDKATYDALPDILKAEYKGDGAGYVLDTDEDNEAVDTLRRALENSRNDTAAEKEAKRLMKARLDEIDEKIRTGVLSEAQANKDVEKLTELFTVERETLRTELTGVISKKDQQLKALLLDGKAESLARELSGEDWVLILPHIKARLSVDLNDDAPSLKVLSADGQPSTLSLEDFKKELLNNKAFARILIGVDSSGGGANQTTGAVLPKKPEEYTEAERTALFNSNRVEFDRLFPRK